MGNDLRQSQGWARFLASQGWEVEKLRVICVSKNGRAERAVTNYELRIFIRKIPLIGSVIKIQRPKIIPPVKEIDRIAKKHHAFCVKLEPANSKQLTAKSSRPLAGFVRDSAPSLPTKDTIVSLTKSEKELWKTLSPDTRHDIEEAEKNRISVASHQPGDKKFDQALESFFRLLSETGRRKGFWSPNFKQLKAKTEAFGKNSILLLAHPPSSAGWRTTDGQVLLPNRPIAGFLILIHNGTAYYHYTATSIAGRKLSATYLLMWKTMLKAKNLGLGSLNLGSIYDPRYHKVTKGWQNFSTFKKKWRGNEVEYPIPLIKYYHPAAKFLSKLGANL